jgi:putative lipoic acid-binding regulatory protein
MTTTTTMTANTSTGDRAKKSTTTGSSATSQAQAQEASATLFSGEISISTRTKAPSLLALGAVALLVCLLVTGADAFTTAPRAACTFQTTPLQRSGRMSGMEHSADADSIVRRMARSSFEAVPEPHSDDDTKDDNTNGNGNVDGDDMDQKLSKLMKEQQDKIAEDLLTPKANNGSGLPVGKVAGFGQAQGGATTNKGAGFGTPPITTYTAIGAPPVNDINKPEYDPEGYMLYTDEKTGGKSRVFEALITYPTEFKIKIVGKNEGTFVKDIVELVRNKCEASSDDDAVPYSTKVNGKWVSVTVAAPVQNAEMLYELYETIDADPRVRFKF